jgi:hypothetical protein
MAVMNRDYAGVLASALLLAFLPDAQAIPPNLPPDLTLKVAGSTIQDNNLVKVLENLCLSGTLDTFKDADPKGKSTYWKAFYCQIDSSKVPGLTLLNPKLLVLKRNRSGTITGVYPLMEPNKGINFMGVANDLQAGQQCIETLPGSRSWACRTGQPGDLFKAIPDMGVLDTDPQVYRGANYNPLIDDVTFSQPSPSAIAAQLNIQNAGGVLENTPVTLGLRNALQEAAIAQGRMDPVCLTDAALRETADCMPSLSKALIASLFAGRVSRWSDIQVQYTPSGSSTLSSKPLTDFNKGSISTDLVHICRRNVGASTQAALNSYFLNTPCASAGTLPVEISNPAFGPVVLAPTQVTATEYCLADLNDGSNNGALNAPGTKAWAISMLTTERNTKLSLNYRFIKIDGAAPTPEEVAAGRYQFFVEGAWVWRKVDPKPSGDLLALIRRITADATTPSLFGRLNADIAHPWGTGTFIATSGQDYQPGVSFDPNAPVTAYTHAPDGSLDNCIAPQVRSDMRLQY